MDFKISDTNKGNKSLIYDGFIYRIDGVLKCGDISYCTARDGKSTQLYLNPEKMCTMGF